MRVVMKQDVSIEKTVVINVEEYKAGEIYDLPDELANDFITNGKAVSLEEVVESLNIPVEAEEITEVAPEISVEPIVTTDSEVK